MKNKELSEKVFSVDLDMGDQDINKNQIKTFFIRKRKIIFLFISLIVIAITASVVIIALNSSGSSEEKKQKKEGKDEDNKEKENEPEKTFDITKYYSQSTKSYLTFLKSLEQNDEIAYHWTFDNSMENNYQYLYDNESLDTSLKFENSSYSNFLIKTEISLLKEAEEKQYIDENPDYNKPKPTYHVLGPSTMLNNEYIEGQKISSKDSKIFPKKWGGITLSVNLRSLNEGNNNNGRLFGWGSKKSNEPGCYISIEWGVILYKCGKFENYYGYDDSVNIGYNESDASTKNLFYRPFYQSKKWHQIILSVREVVDEEDLTYVQKQISNIKIGDIFLELIIDGISRKNVTTQLLDDYDNLLGFSFINETRFNDNENWYIDNIIILKRGISLNEAKILYYALNQKEDPIIPIISKTRCKIPGEQYGPAPTDIYKESDTKLSGEIKFLHLTEKWSCLGVNYNKFLVDRIDEYCGQNLREVDINYFYGKLAEYQHDFIYLFDTIEVSAYYLPQIKENFHNLTSFQKYIEITSTDKNGGNKQSHKIVNFGLVLNSEGVMNLPRFEKSINGTRRITFPQSVYYVYFELENSYEKDRIYTIKLKNSMNEEKFSYNDNNIISNAIKVNQVGYSPNVENHYAYVGRWLGTYGHLPLEKYVGKTFYLKDKNGNIVYQNTITWRSEQDLNIYYSSDYCLINGEITLLLDFSAYKGNGEDFYIYIPGIGRSFSFGLSNKSVFSTFYTVFRALYQQRTGIEKVKPYTNWEYGAHHKGIYVAHHIPNSYQYGNDITNDETGEPISDFSQFAMIELTKTDEFWEDVYGGHADAGDYDNRPFHLRIVENLASIWFKKKNLLHDNQFNIPESGDGIPDILNEMEWNLLIHYKVQQKFGDGSVSTWIESNGHPSGGDPGNDTMRYYVGLRTREDTLRYVTAAGVLALAFDYCDNCPRSYYDKWKKSAEWAWEWASNEMNKCIYSFDYNNMRYTYREPEVAGNVMARAALTMYKLSGKNEKYKKYIFNDITSTDYNTKYTEGMKIIIDKVRNNGAFEAFPVTFFLDDPDFISYLNQMRMIYQAHTLQFINNQNNGTQYTYRNAYFYQADHPYYMSMGWGNFMGGPQIEFIIIGLFIYEGQEKYKDFYNSLLQSLSYYYDFNFGCNHYGRSFTTGLGKIYPLRFLSHPNWWLNNNGIWDPIPGITLYFFTGSLDYYEIQYNQRMCYNPYEMNNFKGIDINVSPFLYNVTEPMDTYVKVRDYLNLKIPFWHRTTNLEGLSVSSTEFTVWETINKMIMMTGFLMDKDEKNVNTCLGKSNCPSIFPTDELLNKKPQNITNLLSRWNIP